MAPKGHIPEKQADVRQAVIVDYKAVGHKSPGGPQSKPFLQYTLEWLLIERFEEIFICCPPDNSNQLRDLVKQYLKSVDVPPSTIIQVHASKNNLSTGDCLRDLDDKALIKADFVIMDVGCCGNLALAELIEAHKAIKKKDKKIIVTSVVRNIFTKDPANIGQFPIYVIEPKSGQLLHYRARRDFEVEYKRPVKKSIEIPRDIFLEQDMIQVNTNLCSTNLSVYSSNVPALFREPTMSDHNSEADLITAAFDGSQVVDYTVYVHIVDDLFSQRMADFGFVINQKYDRFDTNLVYKRDNRSLILRKLVNDSLIDCTKLNPKRYLDNLNDDYVSDDEEDGKASASSVEGDVSDIDDDDVFLREVLESLLRGYEESIENKNLILEVNGSKHAYNTSMSEVYNTIAKALMMLPEKLTQNRPGSVKDYCVMVEKIIEKFTEFLLNYMKNDESRVVVTNTIEDLCIDEEIKYLTPPVLAKTFYKLYDIDALDEDSILSWHDEYDETDARRKMLRQKPQILQLVDAMGDGDESSDADEDSDSDD